jgi:hypothetical protein
MYPLMGGARALIASLGASISLVAGAALSLLVVSFVFAYGGFIGSTGASTSQAALVISSPSASPVRGETTSQAAPVVISAPRATSTTTSTLLASQSPSPPRRDTSSGASHTQPAFTPRVTGIDPAIHEPSPAKTSPPQPKAGDGVRDLGDAVTATVQGTGDAAGAATAPLLGPPVSKAVQQVLDLVASLLKGATGGLAGTLDKAVPR